MKRSVTLLAPTLILLFWAGPSARADQMSFGYNWQPVTNSNPFWTVDPSKNFTGYLGHDDAGVQPNQSQLNKTQANFMFTNEPGGSAGGPLPATFQNPGGPFGSSYSTDPVTHQVTYTEKDPTTGKVKVYQVVGATDTPATNLTVNSTQPADNIGFRIINGKPVAFPHDGDYSLALTLTDAPNTLAATSKTITFNGELSASFSSSNSNSSNTILGANTWTGVVGTHTYHVYFESYGNPGPPVASRLGSISFHIDQLSPSDGTGHGVGGLTPEPSSMLLSCLGLSFLGAASWRKRRARAVVTLA